MPTDNDQSPDSPPTANRHFPPQARALGEPTHVYTLRKSVYRREVTTGVVEVVAGLVAIIVGMGVGLDGLWPAALFGIVIGCALLYVGGQHLRMMYRERGVITLVARNGIVRLGRRGVALIRWRDIDTIKVVPNYAKRIRLYIIRTKDGDILHYFDTTIKGIIGETIQYRHAQEWLPKLAARFDEGEAIHFGHVRIDPEGVHVRDTHYEWRSIHRFERRDGLINAFVQDQWYTIVAIADVENSSILLGLMEHGLKTRKSA